MKKLILPVAILLLSTACFRHVEPPIKKSLTLVSNQRYQKISGFGVNITPAQWNDGKLMPVIDKLVNELGVKLVRFDCTGLANWLDPSRRIQGGTYPQAYLDSVYHSKPFMDAWETFRYFNGKGIQPVFSISGRIMPALATDTAPQRLADFDGYAEMVVTMLKHARDNQMLEFSMVSPFNETDIGYPEGPKIDADAIVPATRAIINKLMQYNLADVKLVVPDDAHPNMDKLYALLSDTSLVKHIAAFGTHTYGNGDLGEAEMWYNEETGNAKFVKAVRNSSFSNAPVWMTEYGDLDQTGEIEFEVAWRSTRRLLKFLRDGFNGGIAWDAFDNFHEHDTCWATYGLLKTDTLKWKYYSKKRFYAAKQVFQFIKPGWYLAKLLQPQSLNYNVYKQWQDPFRNFPVLAFVSPNSKDFTIVGMNNTEHNVDLTIFLSDLHTSAYSQKVVYYRTNKDDDCSKVTTYDPNERVFAMIPPKTIFTLTTLNQNWRLTNWFSK